MQTMSQTEIVLYPPGQVATPLDLQERLRLWAEGEALFRHVIQVTSPAGSYELYLIGPFALVGPFITLDQGRPACFYWKVSKGYSPQPWVKRHGYLPLDRARLDDLLGRFLAWAHGQPWEDPDDNYPVP